MPLRDAGYQVKDVIGEQCNVQIVGIRQADTDFLTERITVASATGIPH